MSRLLVLWSSVAIFSCSQQPANEATDSPAGGGPRAGGANQQGAKDATEATTPQALRIVETTDGLGPCSAESIGLTVYVAVPGKFFYCAASGWSNLDISGKNGLTPLVVMTDEGKGTHCPFAGTKFEAGIDADANGILGPLEVAYTKYVCNGNDSPELPQARMLSLVITPANENAPAGFNPQFTAVATWSNGMKLDVTLSSLLVWSSSDTAKVEMSNFAGARGMAYLASEGTAAITATYDGQFSATTEFTVTPAVIRTLYVNDSRELVLGLENRTNAPVEAWATYSNFEHVDITAEDTTLFLSGAPSLVTVSNGEQGLGPKGQITAVGFGCANITLISPAVWEVPVAKKSWLEPWKYASASEPRFYSGVTIRRPVVWGRAELKNDINRYHFRSGDIPIIQLDVSNAFELIATYDGEGGHVPDVAGFELPVYAFTRDPETHPYTISYDSPGMANPVTRIGTVGGYDSVSPDGSGRITVDFQLPETYPQCAYGGSGGQASSNDGEDSIAIIIKNGMAPPPG